jgi:hypothetical protein
MLTVVTLAAGCSVSGSRTGTPGPGEQVPMAGDAASASGAQVPADRDAADLTAADVASDLEDRQAPAVVRIAELSDLPPGPVEHIEVAYFHRTQRCHSCIEAERLTRLTLDTYFPDEVARGDISLLIADVEAADNTDLVLTYDAWTSSLFLGVTKDGTKYVYSVADMWLTIGEEARFVQSLRSKFNAIRRSA